MTVLLDLCEGCRSGRRLGHRWLESGRVETGPTRSWLLLLFRPIGADIHIPDVADAAQTQPLPRRVQPDFIHLRNRVVPLVIRPMSHLLELQLIAVWLTTAQQGVVIYELGRAPRRYAERIIAGLVELLC